MKHIFFRLIVITLGALIGSLIVYFKRGEFPTEVFSGFIVGGGIIILIFASVSLKKKDKTPSVDERVISNVRQFLLYSLLISVGILSIFILSLDIMGFDSIPLTYLYAFLFILYLIVGLGGLIVKRG